MRIRMSFAQELPILTGTVTANALDAALTLAYTVSTGDYTDVLPDQEVEIRRAGAFVGRLRVRGSGTTSTVLPVGEFSKGMVTVLAGDTLAVLNAWRIRYRLPSADEDFAPDHQTYVDQHKEPAPLACSGRNVVGFAVDLSAVQHDGSLSRNVAFGSTPSNVGHSWGMPGGNTSSSASPVFDYSDLNAGTHWGSHTVEDLTTGKTTTQRKVVRVHDDSDLPYEVLDAQLNGTPDGGSTLEVTLPDTVDIEDVADGAMGWLWIEGGSILYEGYLLGDSIQKDPQTETISFRMTSARGILELLPGFSTVLETVFTPTSWLEAFATTVNAAILYRLRELTTVEVTCDIQISTGIDYPYPLYYLQESVPYAQVLELADAKDCLFTCTRTNLLRVVKPTWLMTDVERAAADTQQAFDADNVFTLDETREHRYPYSQVEGSGFAGDAPLFSRAPGNAPAEGPQKTTAERMITVSQSELNQRTGRRYGRLNALLFGKPIRKSSLNVLPTLYGLDPAYVDQFVTLDGITTKRGLTHDTTRMSLESLSESYSADTNGGLPEIDVDLQEETDGVPGVTYVPPINETGEIDVGDYIDYIDYTPPLPDYRAPGRGWAQIALLDAGGLLLTDTFDTASPTWGYNAFPLDVSESIVDGVQSITTTTRTLAATNTKLRVYDDCLTVPVDTYDHAFRATSVFRSLNQERSTPNWIACITGYTDGIYYEGSIDGGATAQTPVRVGAAWNPVQFWTATAVNIMRPALWVSPHVAGVAYTISRDGSSVYHLYKTTDYGATWNISTDWDVEYSVAGTNDAFYMEVPFQDTSKAYIGRKYAAYNFARSLDLRCTAGGNVLVYPAGGSGTEKGNQARRGFRTCDSDPLKLITQPVSGTGSGNYGIGLFKSNDGGDTWTEIIPFTNIYNQNAGVVMGGDGKAIYRWGSGFMDYCDDFDTMTSAADLEDKTGTGYSGVPINLWGF